MSKRSVKTFSTTAAPQKTSKNAAKHAVNPRSNVEKNMHLMRRPLGAVF
jgi:hypothetical protein